MQRSLPTLTPDNTAFHVEEHELIDDKLVQLSVDVHSQHITDTGFSPAIDLGLTKTTFQIEDYSIPAYLYRARVYPHYNENEVTLEAPHAKGSPDLDQTIDEQHFEETGGSEVNEAGHTVSAAAGGSATNASAKMSGQRNRRKAKSDDHRTGSSVELTRESYRVRWVGQSWQIKEPGKNFLDDLYISADQQPIAHFRCHAWTVSVRFTVESDRDDLILDYGNATDKRTQRKKNLNNKTRVQRKLANHLVQKSLSSPTQSSDASDDWILAKATIKCAVKGNQ